MASDNLILRSGTFHVRLVIPKDVRHILNRTEFTESLKTGSKAEAQMKKYAFLQVWKQLIINARKLVAGPTPEELPEASFGISTMINTKSVKSKRPNKGLFSFLVSIFRFIQTRATLKPWRFFPHLTFLLLSGATTRIGEPLHALF